MRDGVTSITNEDGLTSAQKKALNVLREGGYKPVLYKVKVARKRRLPLLRILFQRPNKRH